MKLITFNAENVPVQRKGDAFISLSRNAANSLSKYAVERTGFQAGELIAIHQDEENPGDWYISLGEKGFELRDSGKEGSLAFNNVRLSNMILDAVGVEEERAAFLLAGEPTIVDEVEYWGIITAKPIIKTRKSKK